MAAAVAAEFGFDLGRCVLIKHEKGRVSGEACARHWHLLVRKWDPVRRRVLDASWMRPWQEKLSRLAETRLGHAAVKGRWNAAVERRLRAEGFDREADAVAPLGEAIRPEAAFTAANQQAAARAGLPLSAARLAVADTWRRGDTAAARTYPHGEDRLPWLRRVGDLSDARMSVVKIRGRLDGDYHRG